MTTAPKVSLKELISKINHKEAEVVERIYIDYREIIDTIPASTAKHQAWTGGYLSHIEEAMNIGNVIFETLSACRPVGCTLSDVLFCIFLHDFDKVQRFRFKDGKLVVSSKYSVRFVYNTAELLRDKYNYILSNEQLNALKYAHGEGQDHNPTKRIMLPLATLVHCADIISARVWFDSGQSHEKWEVS